MARWVSRAAGFALVAYCGVAHACPVCFSAKDEAQRRAFFDTTIFLTLLPLAMIGGIAYWLFKRAAAMEAEEAAESASRTPAEPMAEVESVAAQPALPTRAVQ